MGLTKERGANLIFFLIGLYGLILSLRLPLGDWREPGPGFLPLGLSALLIASGVLWLLRGKKEDKGKKKERVGWREGGRKLLTPAKILGVTVVFVLLLGRTGYLLASFLYVLALFLWISRFSLWVSFSLALVIGLGSWYFFGTILGVALPRGSLFPF
jgi:hypothetical protein